MKVYTLDEQITELKRELGVRTRVYPDWIRNMRITKDKAESQSGALRAAIKTLENLKPVQTGLF